MEKLTTDNISEGIWILDENGVPAKVLKVDSDKRERSPHTKTFTYRLYHGHNCWTSVNKYGSGYVKHILPKNIASIFNQLENTRQ